MNDALRRLARDRAGGRCEYCQLPDSLPPLESFHLEHIVARQHGGKTEIENLAWSCHRCNYYKGPNLTSIDPETQALCRYSIHAVPSGNCTSSSKDFA
jgi:5-methylcytosine-specific restriction endonuclease McrA